MRKVSGVYRRVVPACPSLFNHACVRRKTSACTPLSAYVAAHSVALKRMNFAFETRTCFSRSSGEKKGNTGDEG